MKTCDGCEFHAVLSHTLRHLHADATGIWRERRCKHPKVRITCPIIYSRPIGVYLEGQPVVTPEWCPLTKDADPMSEPREISIQDARKMALDIVNAAERERSEAAEVRDNALCKEEVERLRGKLEEVLAAHAEYQCGFSTPNEFARLENVLDTIVDVLNASPTEEPHAP